MTNLFAVFLANVILVDYDRMVGQMILDAQASNAALIQSGTLHFDVSQTIKGKRPVQIVGDFSWKHDSGFWNYKLSDPDHTVTARQSFSGPIEEAQIEYMLLSNDILYSYSAATNVLHIRKTSKDHPISTAFFLFDLFPATLWDSCCPPHHSDGRLWAEMLGPDSAASTPRSTHELQSTGEGIYQYVREDPERGKLTTIYSLAAAGHPISTSYDAVLGKFDSTSISYEWQKIGKAVVLRSCESRRIPTRNPQEATRIYKAKLDRVDVSSPIANTMFSFEGLSRLLPKNTIVNNHISVKQYPLNKPNGPTDDFLKDLAKKARSRGFTRMEDPK